MTPQMMVLNTQAIVIKSVKYKENDLILTLFSRKLGKVSAIAKGAKKSKSPLLSTSQVFSYGNYTLKKQGEMYRVYQADLIKSFYNIAYNIDSFAYATYITKLVENSIFENQSNNRLFVLLAQTLNLYLDDEVDKRFLTRVFELKYLDYMGLKPQINRCTSCLKVDNSMNIFNINEGGIICNNCKTNYNDNIDIDVTTIRLMEYILSNEVKICVRAKVSKYILYQLENLLIKYLKTYVENLNLKSLYMLKNINKGVDEIE